MTEEISATLHHKKGIRYEKLAPACSNRVIEAIVCQYMSREILAKSLNLTRAEKEAYAFAVCEFLLPQMVCIGAYHDVTHELCGVSMNRLGDYPISEYCDQLFLNLPERASFLDRFDDKSEENLETFLPSHKYLHIDLLFVFDNFVGRGIGSELVRQSMQMAHRADCDTVLMHCTSQTLLRIGAQLGFKCVSRMDMRAYADPLTGARIFAQCAEKLVNSSVHICLATLCNNPTNSIDLS